MGGWSFGAQAGDYERGRPGYPLEAVRWAIAGRRLVLDIGAGTGKLTRAILHAGCEVIAADLDPVMLGYAPSSIARLRCRAAALPLVDHSVDAIVAGQSIHWFDDGAAAGELRRVAKPASSLALVEMLYRDDEPWVSEFCLIYGPTEVASKRLAPPARHHIGFGDFEIQSFEDSHVTSYHGVLARLRSSSRYIKADPQKRAGMTREATRVVPRDVTSVAYECRVWRAGAA